MGGDTSLIARFKCGSRSAFQRLFRSHYGTVVATAGRRLGAPACGVADAQDVAQSVFHNLWKEVAAGRPLGDRLTDRESLLRILALLTAQKVTRLRRDARRQKRDDRRAVTETDLGDGDAAGWAVATDARDDPAWRAAFRETWGELLAVLTERQQVVVAGRLAERTNAEIAVQMRVSTRTVERALSEVRSIWVERFGPEPVASVDGCRTRRPNG